MSFDRKFGADFLKSVPLCPGVYRVWSASGELIYVGKAKNLRRRLSQYKNAKRRKAHFKMRTVVAEAERIEFEVCASDHEALLLEARLIQDHRPRLNVAGAFYFMYPMIGIKEKDGVLSFCFTTQPEAFSGYEFHGAFRSRHLTGQAFFSLMKLLAWIGHRNRSGRGKRAAQGEPVVKYSYVFEFRRLPPGWKAQWEEYFSGKSNRVFESLVLELIENAAARKKSAQTQKLLNSLRWFWRHEATLLASAIERTGHATYPVAQKERDFLMLRYRHLKQSASPRRALRLNAGDKP